MSTDPNSRLVDSLNAIPPAITAEQVEQFIVSMKDRHGLQQLTCFVRDSRFTWLAEFPNQSGVGFESDTNLFAAIAKARAAFDVQAASARAEAARLIALADKLEGGK